MATRISTARTPTATAFWRKNSRRQRRATGEGKLSLLGGTRSRVQPVAESGLGTLGMALALLLTS